MEKDLLRILSFQAESVSRGTIWCSTPSMWMFVLVIFGSLSSVVLTGFPPDVWDSKKVEKIKQWGRQNLVWAIRETYSRHIFVQALSQGNNTEALAFIQRCKDMLLRLPKDVRGAPITSPVVINAFLGGVAVRADVYFAWQTAYLSLMCYNFGVDTYNMRKFEDSTIWLR